MPLTLVQLSSGFPGWNVGVEHLFNDSERVGREYKCRNGSNINFCLLVSICCSSGNDVWAGLCPWTQTGVCSGVSLQPVQNSREGPQQGTGHPICSLIPALHEGAAARDGRKPPHSGGVNPCGSRTNSTGC